MIATKSVVSYKKISHSMNINLQGLKTNRKKTTYTRQHN